MASPAALQKGASQTIELIENRFFRMEKNNTLKMKLTSEGQPIARLSRRNPGPVYVGPFWDHYLSLNPGCFNVFSLKMGCIPGVS